MRKTILIFIAVVCSISMSRADDFKNMKDAIISELLFNAQEIAAIDRIIADSKINKDDIPYDSIVAITSKSTNDRVVERLMTNIGADDKWADIDYANQNRTYWDPRRHVDNILAMAKSYKDEHSKFYSDPKLLNVIIRATTKWCDMGLQCDNWWYNRIGVPQAFAPALILLEDDLPEELMARSIKIIDPADYEMTGQNMVWVMGVTLMKGLLLGDNAMVRRTSDTIKSVIVFAEKEGIKSDYSFHQHGSQMQMGGYGLHFACSISYWARILSGSAYDLSTEQKQLMRNYIGKGLNRTVWRGSMDLSACGRQLFKRSMRNHADKLLAANLNMIIADKDGGELYESYIERNYITPEQNNLVGNLPFPVSKYTIHRADDFMFSVRMFSKTIIGGEIINNENLKGYYLADGSTMIDVTGDEYTDIFPIWDGKYMPGTTVELNDKPLKRLIHWSQYLNGSDFAGGIGEGRYGVSAIEYIRDGVRTNKSYFFLDSVVVCLGNNITVESGEPAITTLNQVRAKDGASFAVKGKVINLENGKDYSAERVYSDGVGYETLDGAQIEFKVMEQSGDWHDVANFYPSEVVTGNVFTAQIKHSAGTPGSYAYVIKPAIAESEFYGKGATKESFVVTQNDENATIVELNDKSKTLIVFWRGGSVKTKNFKRVKATDPAMVILERDATGVKTNIYDPQNLGAAVFAN